MKIVKVNSVRIIYQNNTLDKYLSYEIIFLIDLLAIVDAFVALGGNPDGTGRVLKQSMLKIIKEEFDLTFDMEKIMERIEASSEELDYHTFCMLFDTQEENRNRRNSRTSTMLSVNRHIWFVFPIVLRNIY